MLRNKDGHRSRRTRVTLVLAGAIALSGVAASPAAAGPLAAPNPLGAPVFATAAAGKAVPLSKAGLSASGAALVGRTLTVTVRARRATSVTFGVVSGAKVLTSARASVPKGTKALKLTLPTTPRGTGLRLRVSARAGKRTARSTIALKVATPTTPSSPTGGAPTATSTPTTPAMPNDVVPPPTPTTTPRVTLSAATVPENQPSGTAVGTLATADAPTVGVAPQFTLVTGTGDTDNASFTVDGTTLRTAASFDFEAKSQYAIRVRATDGGSVETALTVAVTNVNEAPVLPSTVSVPDGRLTIAGSSAAFGNTPLVVTSGRDAPTTTGGPEYRTSGDLLQGVTDPEGDPLSTVAETKPTTKGGSVTIESDGDLVYQPEPGCASGLDTFKVTVSDGHGGTVLRDVEIARRLRSSGTCVWYVDPAAAAGGTGTAAAPFNSLSALNTAASDPDVDGDNIHLAAGTYSGAFTLEPNERLSTFRSGLTLFSQQLVAPHPAASVTLGGGTLTPANGSSVQGLSLGSTSGPALAGALTGTFAMSDGSINNTTGAAVDLTGGTLAIALTNVSSLGASGGSPNALRLDGTAGTFSAGAGALQNATGTTLVLTGSAGSGTVNFTYGGTVVDASGQLIDINNQGGGTKDFNGLLYSLGTDGVSLSSNTGATIRFDGGMTLQRVSAGNVLSASGGGTLAITDPAGATTNDLYAAAGTALSVTDATIGADGLTFASLGASGGTSGIVLSNTGAGGLTVTGTGSALAPAGSPGGLVTGMSGPGVSLTNVGGPVALTGMEIKNGLDDGVRADNVADLTLTNPKLTTNGNAAGDQGLDLTTGATGVKRLTVTGAQVTGNATAVGRGISALATGTAGLKVSIKNSTFSGITPESVWIKTVNDLTAAPTIDAEVLNNTIGTATARSGSISQAAIAVAAVARGTVHANVANNTLQQYIQGMALEQTNGTAYSSGAKGRLDVTLSGNTLSSPNTSDNPNATGVQVNAGVDGSDAGTLCLDAGANTLAAASAGVLYDLVARQVAGSDLLLPGYAGGASDGAAASAYLSARLGSGDALAQDLGAAGSFVAGTCTLPLMGT